MLEESEAQYPLIQVSWENSKPYSVLVNVHDILELQYKVDRFYEMIDVLNSAQSDIKRTFKLDKNAKFKLKFAGDLKDAHKLAYVGRYFEFGKINHVKMMLVFA